MCKLFGVLFVLLCFIVFCCVLWLWRVVLCLIIHFCFVLRCVVLVSRCIVLICVVSKGVDVLCDACLVVGVLVLV